jgi:adenine-specific DNA glycosylase
MLAWKKQQKPLDRLSVEPLPPFKHVFTHRLWEITPFRIHCPKVCTLIGQGVESGEWVKHQDVFKRGLAAPVSKLLQSR